MNDDIEEEIPWTVRITRPDGTHEIVPFNDYDPRHQQLMVVGIKAVIYCKLDGDYRYEMERW